MKARFLLLLALAAVGSLGTGRGADSFFPLMAWNWAPSDAATFHKLRECGLTVAGFVSPKELDLCHAAGLKAIVSDGRVSGHDWRKVDAAVARRNVAQLVAETGSHPAVYGYYLRDEPGADAFAGLATVADIVRELAPGKWPYINLFTTLAYGGRGIAYFTYFAPPVGNYRMAPIDQFGNPTPTWSALQNVNRQVGQLAPTLLQLTSDEVYHFGAVPEGAHAPNESSLVTAVGNAPFLVGEFTHADGSRYALVVNKDSLKSHYAAITFRQPPRRVQLVSPYTGQLTDFTGEQQWLAAGQGALLRLD